MFASALCTCLRTYLPWIPHSLTHSHLELELLDGAARVGVAAWEDLFQHLLIDVEVVHGLESRLL